MEMFATTSGSDSRGRANVAASLEVIRHINGAMSVARADESILTARAGG